MRLNELIEIDNKQLYSFTREQTQVFLTARLGDGCIATTNSNSTYYSSNCKYLEYLEFKKKLIGKGKIKYQIRNGYSQTPIYTYYGGAYPDLKKIKELPLQDVVNNLDSLGIALWFYDDGSLHKRDHYYNLNTQGFSREIQEQIFIPFFNKLNIFPKIRIDNSHNHPLYFLGINKYEGAYIINQILRQYPINCYSYKLWSSETIQIWSKLQEQLKSADIPLTNRQLSNRWRYIRYSPNFMET